VTDQVGASVVGGLVSGVIGTLLTWFILRRLKGRKGRSRR
jgi:hypothetical protein